MWSQIIPFTNKKIKLHERGFVTKFDENGQRNHLIIGYKYYETKTQKIKYFFWVHLHQDIKIQERHIVKKRGFKCPFCEWRVTELYNFPIHFKKVHIQGYEMNKTSKSR